MKLISWIKANKIATVLIVLVGYLIVKNLSSPYPIPISKTARTLVPQVGSPAIEPTLDQVSSSFSGIGIVPPPPGGGIVTPEERSNRLVVTNSNLSLLVTDVRKNGEDIIDFVNTLGGFMVSASYNRPEESPFAVVIVRVPSENLDKALEFFRSKALKVTSENLVGQDVTAEFVDIEARIETLDKTKSKFEGILDQATEVQDILVVQREIINTQAQIDNLKGQRDAIEKNAKFSKVTVYLSTDELALPYAPDEAFRPNLIFKLAARSLLNSLQSLATAAIWLVVYTLILIPAVLGYLLYRRRKKQKRG